MAGANRLVPFTDFEMLDNIVIASAGAYKHDEVFMMSLNFVYKLTMLHYEKQMYQHRYGIIENEINKK